MVRDSDDTAPGPPPTPPTERADPPPGPQVGHRSPGDDPGDVTAEVAARVGSAREAAWIVEHVVGAAGAVVRAGGDRSLREAATALADRRAAGEPLQYVLGGWQFRSLELAVDPRVLIPRPETEQVVEVALGELARMASGRGAAGRDPLVCVDLGTGSGAIALSLAAEGPSRLSDRPGGPVPFEVWATDRSSDALEVARANLASLADVDPAAAGRVTLAEGRWFEALPPHLTRRVDLVVSNPPYVSEEEFDALEPTVRDWEPVEALVSARGRCGVPGMADIEEVVAGAAEWLRPTGALVVEVAPAQVSGAIDVARRAGFARVASARDLAGRLRMLVAVR